MRWWFTPIVMFRKSEIYYIPKHFKIQELVDRETYNKYGERSIQFMDARIVRTADKIREYFGKSMTINNWLWDGDREWSGLRTPKSPYYSTHSQHSFGRAIDFLIKGVSAEEVRAEILKKPWHNAFKYITTLEDDVDWVHADTRAYGKNKNGIFLFKP